MTRTSLKQIIATLRPRIVRSFGVLRSWVRQATSISCLRATQMASILCPWVTQAADILRLQATRTISILRPWVWGVALCVLALFCVSVAVSNTCVDRSSSAQITTAEKLLGAADTSIQEREGLDVVEGLDQEAQEQVSGQTSEQEASNALGGLAEKHFLEDSQVRFSENPLVSENPNASTIAKQLGFGTTRQKSAPCVEGGSYMVAQMGRTSIQQVVSSLFITSSALQNIPSAEGAPENISLVEGASSLDTPTTGESSTAQTDESASLDSLTAAIRSMESQGYEVGCFFVDLNSGEGIAYNLDTRIYGASSFKGVYAAYLSEQLADGESGLSASAVSLMDDSIRYSDNNAFSTLRNSYDGAGFARWVESCGVSSDIVHDTHFPRYSARESALFWLHTYRYLQSGTDAASHLRELYTQTNVSFIRDGVTAVVASGDKAQRESDAGERENGSEETAEESSGKSVVVMNKAGWIASSPRFSGLCDAGLIECGGHTYLMSIMTSAPDSASHRDQVVTLAKELFTLRS